MEVNKVERIQILIKELHAIKNDIDHNIRLAEERMAGSTSIMEHSAYDWTQDILLLHVDRLEQAINKYFNNFS